MIITTIQGPTAVEVSPWERTIPSMQTLLLKSNPESENIKTDCCQEQGNRDTAWLPPRKCGLEERSMGSHDWGQQPLDKSHSMKIIFL